MHWWGAGRLPWGCVGAQCGWQEVAVVHCSCIAWFWTWVQCVCSAVQRPPQSTRICYTPHFFIWQAAWVSLQVVGASFCPKCVAKSCLPICLTTLLEPSSFSSKGVELLVCDLLLTLRTSIWQRGGSSNGEPGPAPGSQLAGFQRDLSALRKVTQCYRQAQHKVHTQLWSQHIWGQSQGACVGYDGEQLAHAVFILNIINIEGKKLYKRISLIPQHNYALLPIFLVINSISNHNKQNINLLGLRLLLMII